MTELPEISIVIPTRDRPRDLANLLPTIIDQDYDPYEVIIVDDSTSDLTKQVINSFASRSNSHYLRLIYVVGSDDGLTAARNLGVQVSRGDAILFLDDDTLMDRNVIKNIAIFLRDNPAAMGVQPRIVRFKTDSNIDTLTKVGNLLYRALMISYYTENEQRLRRSGADIYPKPLTRVIMAQRLFGCCTCYRREVFNSLSFDTNLKRWGFSEDSDFSYRVYKKNPGSLYVVPNITVVHTSSSEARLATKRKTYMRTIYWFYLFFKNMFRNSILNLVAFLWAIVGEMTINLGTLIARRRPKCDWWTLIYLLDSYFVALGNLKNIMSGRLEFFNETLSE